VNALDEKILEIIALVHEGDNVGIGEFIQELVFIGMADSSYSKELMEAQ
jgi:hypothetical protein